MHITIGRWSRLTALGAGLATAAAIAISASGPALADTTDTGGTSTFQLAPAGVLSLAKSGIVMFASGGGTGSWDSGAVNLNYPVRSGTGEVSNFTGSVNLSGKLRVVNAQNGKTVILSGLSLSFDTGMITAKPTAAGASRIALADVGGDLSTDTGTGTETFSCDGLTLDPAAASYLNSHLKTTAFKAGDALGGFTTTFDVTIV